MKLDFCTVCGTKEDLQQHHIIPIAVSGDKRHRNFEAEDDCTVTLCAIHHDMAHGIQKNRSAQHNVLIRESLRKAKESGVVLGRPSTVTTELRIKVYELKDKGIGVRQICRSLNLGTNTYYKIIREPKPEENKVEQVPVEMGTEKISKPTESFLEKISRTIGFR